MAHLRFNCRYSWLWKPFFKIRYLIVTWHYTVLSKSQVALIKYCKWFSHFDVTENLYKIAFLFYQEVNFFFPENHQQVCLYVSLTIIQPSKHLLLLRRVHGFWRFTVEDCKETRVWALPLGRETVPTTMTLFLWWLSNDNFSTLPP